MSHELHERSVSNDRDTLPATVQDQAMRRDNGKGKARGTRAQSWLLFPKMVLVSTNDQARDLDRAPFPIPTMGKGQVRGLHTI